MDTQPHEERPPIRAHKRQFTWQILMPMALVVLAGLVAGGFVIANAASGQEQVGVWADISVIWLIVPALFFALAFLAILVMIVYGMTRLLEALPPYTSKAQGIFNQVAGGVRKLADGTVKPVFWLRQAGATLKSIFKH
jgi:Na+-transporting methylmalonyl-CoA/oxaloacetate decarboxylase gamma subunit